MRQIVIQTVMFLAAFTIECCAHGTNLILNGGFDSGVFGWTATTIDPAGGWRSEGGNPGGMFILNDVGAANSDPTLSQTLAQLAPGARYLLSGNFRGANQSNHPRGAISFAVDLEGVALFTGVASDTVSWRNFAVEFTATSPTVEIRLRGEINGTDNDFAIDNISVERLSTRHCAGDVTGNGVVNGVDLIAVLEAWSTNGNGEFDCDIHDDGVVGADDVACVLTGWGICPLQ